MSVEVFGVVTFAEVVLEDDAHHVYLGTAHYYYSATPGLISSILFKHKGREPKIKRIYLLNDKI